MNEDTASKRMLGIGVAAIIAVIGVMIYFFRASDPAARPPIPYKKFDMDQHMAELRQHEGTAAGQHAGAQANNAPAPAGAH
ncbi:hypothetical protein CCAX7_58640 [Capsulimonas corticalis]|uniref:Uncharacterized protein n=1 Tax=Capsulimonas corticalis TaxID=2219043 RepID=A0A402D028_9BACT|nr:hypothetical protein [Capsulimonas corticalis]BDI33813.1 hypothetical protein CCAX7_58640 [Capsulimonas corticalis]